MPASKTSMDRAAAKEADKVGGTRGMAARSKSASTSKESANDKVGPKMDRGTTAKPAAKAAASKPAAKSKGKSEFGSAFAAARKGGAKEFTFKGKKYNTKEKGE